jgi:DNA repair protein RadC
LSLKIKELPIGERPYEKLELYGEKILSNAELLAIIIKSGTKEETSVELAQKILKLNQNSDEDELNFLRDLSIEELMKIKGIGKVKAIQLKAVCELSIRMNKPTDYKKIKVREPYDIAKILMNDLRFLKREIAKVIILNNKNIVLKILDISLGNTNFANIEIKNVLGEAVKMQAPKIILVHNHPSGDSTPSKSDIQITDRIYEAANLMGIQLLDHIVIGNMEYTSIFTQKLKEQKST